MKCNLYFKHIFHGHTRYKCKCCGEKTWHKFVENKTVIRTLNRSEKQRFGIFKQHYGCVLRATEYYLNKYSVYQCMNCGKLKNMPGFPRRISKEKAKESGLEIMHNLAFWSLMYR